MYKFLTLLTVLIYSSLCLTDDTLNRVSRDYVPAADNEAYYYRPCNFSDHYCIANYIAAHSDATPNVGTIEDSHYRSESNIFIPNYNMSLVQTEIYVSGLNGEFVEFYHNVGSDKLVVAVNYTNLITNATVATFSYQRFAKEPAVTVTSSYEVYPTFTITTVFDDVSQGLEFSKSYSHVYIPVLPNITFTDTANYYPADSANIEAMWTEFTGNLGIVLQEAFQTVSVYYFWSFLQNGVVDFNITEYK